MSYGSSQEHLLEELERVEALLDAAERVLATEDESDDRADVLADAQDVDGGDALSAASDVGIAPDRTGTDDATDRADVDPATAAVRPEQLPLALPEWGRQTVTEMTARIAAKRKATADEPLRLELLADRFDLSRRHLDVLLLALAPRLDQAFHDQYGRLQQNDALQGMTMELIERLFATTAAETVAAGALVGTSSPLLEHSLLVVEPPPEGYPTQRGRQFVVEDRIAEYLRGTEGVDPKLRAAAETAAGPEAPEEVLCLRDCEETVAGLTVGDDRRDRLVDLAATDGHRRAYLYGPEGAPTGRAVGAVVDDDCALQAYLPAIIEADGFPRLYREAALQDRPLHLSGASAVGEGDLALEAVFDRLADLPVDVFVTGSEEWTPTGTMDAELDGLIEFPYPSVQQRRAFWDARAAELPDDLDVEMLASTFTLTQGQLRAALSTARSLADGDVTADDVYEGCRAQSAGELDALAQQLDPTSDWDDIELPDDTMRELRLVRDHVKHQARIYADWDLESKFSRGTGVVALFEGDSGTGKTMAAEVLANDVRMDLYKIDLSSVVSKYIGETEENLEAIFEAAENSNAILLFDEADAVFGDRSEVSEATDRYANVEVNYLLQRIESYDGVVVLTTNYAENIDSAFTRRINHEVSFDPPQESTRADIWTGMFPESVPVGDLDATFLSSFEFTGGQIKTICQTAAIMAAADDRAVGMKHLVRATQLEIEKTGEMLKPDEFGDYRGLLYGSDGPADDGGTERASVDEERDPERPEAVLRAYFERVGDGEYRAANRLYHSGAATEPYSRKQVRRLERRDLSLNDVECVRSGTHRTVLQFVQQVDGTTEDGRCELRPENERWRIFSLT